jgi:hypothetical protein
VTYAYSINSTGTLDWATAYNGTLAKTDAANTFGAFNQTFDTNVFFISASGDRIGILTTAPQNTFNVVGDGNVTGTLYVNGSNISIGNQYATNGTYASWANVVNGTMASWANVVNGTVIQGTNVTYAYSINSTGTLDWATAYNGTLAKTDAANTFGAFNQTLNAGGIFYNSNLNRTGINTTAPNNTLHVVGNLNVTGNVSIGGNLTFESTYDYAELFESDAVLEKGDVVCLDSEKKISKCFKRADRSVVGAVSTNPSIVGRNLNFGKAYAVGLVGVVPVKVAGPVKRFDLLTSSRIPGYAEKATIGDFGAIIGKSMEPCDKKECLVDVLVGLN